MTKKKSATDYKFIKLLGEGSFSSVYLAVDANVARNKIRKYAIKVCLKRHIKKQAKQEAIMREKNILNILNQNPNDHFIKLYCTFQDLERLYFVMTYAENGDLLTYMQDHPLTLDIARDYTIQLIEALEHMHKLDIIHRDLKPENILLINKHLDLLISDFGSAKLYTSEMQQEEEEEGVDDENLNDDINDSSDNLDHTNNHKHFLGSRRHSFVGTAQYVSPEMLKNRQASFKSDLWALGVIIYQMITNVMPFNAPNEYLIYQKIQNLDFNIPENLDIDARDLICNLIKLNPKERLGAKDNIKSSHGYSSLRSHNFLKHASSISSCHQEKEVKINNLADERLDVDTDTHNCISGASSGRYFEPKEDMEVDLDLVNIDQIKPGLDELQLLRILTIG